MCEHARKVHFGCTLESSDRIFLICICGKVFFSKNQLNYHSLEHSLEICDGCLHEQSFGSSVYTHQFYHFQLYKFRCIRCLDRFRTKEDFESKQKHKCDCIRIPAWRIPKDAESAGSNEGKMDASILRSRKVLCNWKGCTRKTSMKVPAFRRHCRDAHNFFLNTDADARFDSMQRRNSSGISKHATKRLDTRYQFPRKLLVVFQVKLQ